MIILGILVTLILLYLFLGYKRVSYFPLGYIRKHFNLLDIKEIGVLIDEREIFEDILRNTVYDSSLNLGDWIYQDNGLLRYNLYNRQEDKVMLLSIYLYEKIKEKLGKKPRIDTIYEFNFENNEKKKELLDVNYKKLNVGVYFLYDEIYAGKVNRYTFYLR